MLSKVGYRKPKATISDLCPQTVFGDVQFVAKDQRAGSWTLVARLNGMERNQCKTALECMSNTSLGAKSKPQYPNRRLRPGNLMRFGNAMILGQFR